MYKRSKNKENKKWFHVFLLPLQSTNSCYNFYFKSKQQESIVCGMISYEFLYAD